MDWPRKYVGLNGEPLSLEEAMELADSPERFLAQEDVEGSGGESFWVSTVLLPLTPHLPDDHPGLAKPWETQVRDPTGRLLHFRYSARQDAVEGHATVKEVVRSGVMRKVMDAVHEHEAGE